MTRAASVALGRGSMRLRLPEDGHGVGRGG